MRSIRLQVLIVLFTVPCAGSAQAGDIWGLCGAPPQWTYPIYTDAADTSGIIELTAEQATLEPTGESRLLGDVTMVRGTQQVFADTLNFKQQENHVQAQGNIKALDETFAIRGETASLNLDTEEGEFTAVDYRIHPLHARGHAQRIERQGPALTLLERASYTTCDEGNHGWRLSASKIRLDHEKEVGSARNVVLRFQRVPFFYTPYISFPISDKRKSGFLAPRIGTKDGGADVSVPYYFNIAPHRDATFTPRYLSTRGLQYNGEFRYLNRASLGELDLSYLDDTQTDTQRWASSFKHRGNLSTHLSTDIALTAVSDATYFEDLGNTLSISSITHLERRADLRYTERYWDLLLRVQGFQTVSDTIADQDKPYQRLPQLRFTGEVPEGPLRLDYSLHSEWVRFERDNSITGDRFDLLPGLSAPLTGTGYFITPSLKARYTQYKLQDTALGDDPRPSRALPITSLDSGLIFERQATSHLRQTLEPRAFYVYIPYRDQEDIPIFDTGELDFNFGQLFREDRFSGADRVGDTNQLSLALTTRLIDAQSGLERLRASIGQISYFQDREVVLPGGISNTDQRSELAAELAAYPTRHWTLRGSLLWDSIREQTERGSTQIQFRKDSRRVVNLAHRYRQNDIEQMDLSFAWPLGRHWRGMGRWTYSLDENRDIETFAGVEYESCCWAVRLVGRRYITGSEDEYNEGVYVQLVLKGLTSLGENVDDFLERGILGYETDY